MRRFLKEYFSFSRSEFWIIIVLSVILMVIVFLRFYLSSVTPVAYVPSSSEMQLVDEFIKSLEIKNSKPSDTSIAKIKVFYNNLREFDPNNVLLSDLKIMGFPDRVISNLTKFRKSGGHFRMAEEFRKIYGITDSVFRKIKPYILIRDTFNISHLKIEYNKVEHDSERININTADSVTLIRLKGIGPVFANRIIKYRNRLGGFFITDQLLEVYGMDSLRYKLIKDRIFADSLNIRKININTVSVSELAKHPYLNIRIARSIIKFRDFRKIINDTKELYSNKVIEENILRKVEPYFYVAPK